MPRSPGRLGLLASLLHRSISSTIRRRNIQPQSSWQFSYDLGANLEALLIAGNRDITNLLSNSKFVEEM